MLRQLLVIAVCAFPSLSLTPAFQIPLCGNEVLESDEQCDDGNTTTGDGCSNLCIGESDCVMVIYDTVPITWKTARWDNLIALQTSTRVLGVRVVEKDEGRDFIDFVTSIDASDLCAITNTPNGLLFTLSNTSPGDLRNHMFEGTGGIDELNTELPTAFSVEAVAGATVRFFGKSFNDPDYGDRIAAANAISSSLICPDSGSE